MNNKNISKLKKIIPISFIVLFAATLFVPNTGLPRIAINAREVAQQENRKIHPFPTASFTHKEFYNQFGNWYQDRLRHKYKLISAWKKVNFAFGVVLSDSLVLGKNGWLLNKYSCINKFEMPQKKADKIKELQNYCEQNGKKFIFMLPPNKESVYRDYFPENIQKKYKSPEYWHEQAYNLLTANSINYLSVNKQLNGARKNEKHDLYFSDDHHWSYYGSAIAADLLMKKLEQELNIDFYNGLKFDGSTRTAYKEYSYANQLAFSINKEAQAPWSKQYTDEIYITDCYTSKTTQANKVVSNDVLWGRIVRGEGIITNKATKNDIKILILGDSYSSYMVPYLSQNIKTIISTHYRDCAEKKKSVNITKLIEKYNPDAVILIMLEGGFFHSKAESLFKNIKY